MKDKAMESRIWSTASYGQASGASVQDPGALKEHLQACNDLSGRLLNFRCRAQYIRRFVAARIVTTLLGLALLADLAYVIFS